MLKGTDVKVLEGDNKRLYQESKKTDEEQHEKEEILENHMEDIERTTKVNGKMPNHHINLCDSFLQKSCNSSNSPDLCFQTFHSDFFPENRFKLKGGSRLKIFDTENKNCQKCKLFQDH